MSVCRLEEVHEEERYGGKAAKLGAALRAGLPVPEGAAVSWDHEGPVAELALRPPLAVRSSAIGEDGARASFAGQHATVLGVDAGGVAQAIERVRASASEPGALAYRARLGLVGDPRMGVVVQRLVDAEIAGVLFTRDPRTGKSERVIEASWGLGEAVVAGLVTPDGYRLRGAEVIERRTGMKDVAIRLAPGGGTQEVEVSPERARAPCLDDARLAALAALADRCEAVFGAGQDLEWAFAGGELHLLQWRPITT